MLRYFAVVIVVPVLGFAVANAYAAGSAMRTVLVVPHGAKHAPRSVGTRDCLAYPRTCVNGAGGVELAYAVTGTAPARTQVARVLTDTNCQADGNGISHCLNKLRLASGRTITVRHDHLMMNDPCLAPGERVLVRALR